eukprot:3843887-Amphidinium_carterae.1
MSHDADCSEVADDIQHVTTHSKLGAKLFANTHTIITLEQFQKQLGDAVKKIKDGGATAINLEEFQVGSLADLGIEGLTQPLLKK